MSARPATHAGTWYSSMASTLDSELTKFISEASSTTPSKNARVLVGPHAGYAYCGSTLAESYSVWDTSTVKNVFIFSPSHYVYFKGARISRYQFYETPLGTIPVNHELIEKLIEENPRDIKYMSSDVDDEEHGIEMHMPMFHKFTEKLPQGVPKIIPILISSSDRNFEKRIASIIAKYLPNKEFSFIVSSDFCHWGSRFDYTMYTPDDSASRLKKLYPQDNHTNLTVPIYKSIEYLDKKAMKVAATGSYDMWKEYIERTGNTICGQKPISIIIAALEKYNEESLKKENALGFNWIGYSQSSKVTRTNDSSVSYASGFVVVD
ncbi:Mho1 protein [Saccharomycopsis crataegensis]|uniref:Mho1 protein n=1 Tax=Saccharomycopsis crataegensis TaxID=43959 RepID=A0AAV5QK88_9ASCO|nr:Mho1 protein [Saccharomycopsis crataegensis]